jgi:hypothetical protein
MIRGGWRDQRALARYKDASAIDLDALRDALREQHWDREFSEASHGGVDD